MGRRKGRTSFFEEKEEKRLLSVGSEPERLPPLVFQLVKSFLVLLFKKEQYFCFSMNPSIKIHNTL
jgi:hypothetical protein